MAHSTLDKYWLSHFGVLVEPVIIMLIFAK